jgi:hypothetical protein
MKASDVKQHVARAGSRTNWRTKNPKVSTKVRVFNVKALLDQPVKETDK